MQPVEYDLQMQKFTLPAFCSSDSAETSPDSIWTICSFQVLMVLSTFWSFTTGFWDTILALNMDKIKSW